MSFRTLTIPADVHALLKSQKLPGESFGDLLRRRMRPPADTRGEALDRLEEMDAHLPPPDPQLDRALASGRGRRSRRPAPRA